MLRTKKAQVYEHFFVDNTRLWRDFLYSIERKKDQLLGTKKLGEIDFTKSMTQPKPEATQR
jgi:hypothetical protein